MSLLSRDTWSVYWMQSTKRDRSTSKTSNRRENMGWVEAVERWIDLHARYSPEDLTMSLETTPSTWEDSILPNTYTLLDTWFSLRKTSSPNVLWSRLCTTIIHLHKHFLRLTKVIHLLSKWKYFLLSHLEPLRATSKFIEYDLYFASERGHR